MASGALPRLAPFAAAAALVGCAPGPAGPPPPPQDGLLLFGPYREPNDACRIAGESAVTANYLDDQADLVACPSDFEGTRIFVFDVDAAEVGRYGGYTLFTVPRPG